jgi:general secretion pathway protein M
MNARRQPSESPHAAVWRQHFDTLTQQAAAWWDERTSQERILLRAGAIVIALALIWTLGLRPALHSIAQSRELLPRLYANAAQVDALILEAQALQGRQSGKIDAASLPEALRASLQRAGLEDSATLNETPASKGGPSSQWEIALANANAERTMQWLAGLPYLLQLQTQAVELERSNIDGRDRPGHVSGRIVVHLPAKAAP